MCFLKIHYHEVVQRDMILTEIVETVSGLSSPTKVILSLGGNNNEENYVLSCIFFLFLACGKKPFFIRQKIHGFKDGGVIGGKLTLRRHSMYTFIFRLLFEILPRMKHFEGFRFPSHNSSFNFILKDIFVFDGLSSLFPYLDQLSSLQVQIHFTTKSKTEVSVLGQGLLFCFF